MKLIQIIFIFILLFSCKNKEIKKIEECSANIVNQFKKDISDTNSISMHCFANGFNYKYLYGILGIRTHGSFYEHKENFNQYYTIENYLYDINKNKDIFPRRCWCFSPTTKCTATSTAFML